MAATTLILAALAVPAVAEATTFTVDSTADETDLTIGGSCLTAAGNCTLRAAIEEANAGSGGDEIAFDEAVFEGDRDDTVTLGSNLPAIIKTTRLDGGRCMTEAGAAGPCAALHGTNSGAALKIEADELSIENLAFVYSATAVEIAGADEFELRGNWFGVQLDGAELGAINATSILAGPGSSDGQIGGKEMTSGNLFVAGVAGIELFGASRVVLMSSATTSASLQTEMSPSFPSRGQSRSLRPHRLASTQSGMWSVPTWIQSPQRLLSAMEDATRSSGPKVESASTRVAKGEVPPWKRL